MPAPGRAETGTSTVPDGFVSATVNAGRKNSPVADSTRPGWDTTRTGFVAPVRLWMSYVMCSVPPCTTGSTMGAGTLLTVPSLGPKVSEVLACATTLPSTDAVYTSGTVRE